MNDNIYYLNLENISEKGTVQNPIYVSFNVSLSPKTVLTKLKRSLESLLFKVYNFNTGALVASFSFPGGTSGIYSILGLIEGATYVVALTEVNNNFPCNVSRDCSDGLYYGFSECYYKFTPLETYSSGGNQYYNIIDVNGNSKKEVVLQPILKETKRRNIYVDHLQLSRKFSIDVSGTAQKHMQGGCIAENYFIMAMICNTKDAEYKNNTAVYIYDNNNLSKPLKVIDSIDFVHANGMTYNPVTKEILIASSTSRDNSAKRCVYRIKLSDLVNPNYDSNYYSSNFDKLFSKVILPAGGIGYDLKNNRYVYHSGSSLCTPKSLIESPKDTYDIANNDNNFYGDAMHLNQDLGVYNQKIFVACTEETKYPRTGTNNQAIHFFNQNKKYLFTLDFASVHATSGMQYVITGKKYSSWECEWVEIVKNNNDYLLVIGVGASYTNANNVRTELPAVFTLKLNNLDYNNKYSVIEYLNNYS